MYYFDPDVNGFIPAAWKDDGTYENLPWPARAVLITLEQYQEFSVQPAAGLALGSNEDGYPIWVPQPGPTPEQILVAQSAKLSGLKAEAEAQKTALTNRISTLQDAIDNVGVEGMEEFAATPEEQIEFPKRKTQLTKWKNYAILLGRVTSQAGWPPDVVWPAKPTEGMDLTVSSVAPSSGQTQ